MKTGRLYNFKTREITEIPLSELAEGFVRAKVEGIDGEVFVAIDQVRLSRKNHGHDLTQMMPILEDIYKKIGDVFPLEWQAWIDGFQADKHPENEIALWSIIAEQYDESIRGRELSFDARKDYFSVILSVVNNGPDAALEVFSPNVISKEDAAIIVNRMRRLH